MSLVSAARRTIKRSPALRSAGYLILELRRIAASLIVAPSADLERTFQAGSDPWAYGREEHRRRHALALAWLDEERPRGLGAVLEVGCAEGGFTTHLSSRADRVLSIDVSPEAVRRASARVPGVEFRVADLLSLAPGEQFDAIIAMDVLEYLRPWEMKRARSRMTALLRPGGLLLITNTRPPEFEERAWWGRVLRLGVHVNAYIAEAEALETIRTDLTPLHMTSLHRKRGAAR